MFFYYFFILFNYNMSNKNKNKNNNNTVIKATGSGNSAPVVNNPGSGNSAPVVNAPAGNAAKNAVNAAPAANALTNATGNAAPPGNAAPVGNAPVKNALAPTAPVNAGNKFNNNGSKNNGSKNKVGEGIKKPIAAGIIASGKKQMEKTKDKIKDAMKGLSDLSSFSEISGLKGVKKWGMIFLIVVIVALIIMIAKYIIVSYYTFTEKGPYLIEGTKNANHTVIISQDPDSINYIPLKRSDNENGIEFTYMFWCLYMDTNLHNKGEWKHVFHKGNSTSYPNRGPGVWFHPVDNKMKVYMNTFKSPLENVEINNIPVKKWFHCSIVLQNKISHLDDEDKTYNTEKGNHILDIYINGRLKKSHQLDGVPKQNNGDVWINLFGGYDGYLSKLRYLNRAVQYEELEDIVKEGPAKVVTDDTGELPPYLDDNWWFNETQD